MNITIMSRSSWGKTLASVHICTAVEIAQKRQLWCWRVEKKIAVIFKFKLTK